MCMCVCVCVYVVYSTAEYDIELTLVALPFLFIHSLLCGLFIVPIIRPRHSSLSIVSVSSSY